MNASFPDGHTEEVHKATLQELVHRVRDALDRRAESVVLYREPHTPGGNGRRCTVCGGLRDDEKLHSSGAPTQRDT